MKTAMVTIAARNYAPQVTTLMESTILWQPDWHRFALFIDCSANDRHLSGVKAELLIVEDLGVGPSRLELMATLYEVTEFATSLKPFAIEYLFGLGFDSVVYLDPDTLLMSPLTEVEEGLSNAAVVLTPHTLNPIPTDGKRPNSDDLRAAGSFNLGFFACTSKAKDVLAWWGEHLVLGAANAPEQNLFTDQRWVDMMLAYIPVHVIRDPGYNVAYWNLHERPLEVVNSDYRAASARLALFHFSGFDPSRPWQLTKHTPVSPRVTAASSGALAELLVDYARMVGSNAVIGPPEGHSIGGAFPGSSLASIPRWLQTGIWRRVRLEWVAGRYTLPARCGDDDAPRLVQWLKSPPGDMDSGGLSRLAWIVWSERTDLQAAFPDPREIDRDPYSRWLAIQGLSEIGIRSEDWQSTFVERLSLAATSIDVSNSDVVFSNCVNLVGYFEALSGVGEAARALARSLVEAGWDVRRVVAQRSSSPLIDRVSYDSVAVGVPTIWCVNADQLALVMGDHRGLRECSTANFGVWFWETTRCPDYFAESSDLLDEVWAPTEFIERSLKCRLPANVVQKMPLSLSFPKADTAKTEQNTPTPKLLPGVRFLVRFDFNSDESRKNPVGAIEAFRLAFPEPGVASLLVKTTNGSASPASLESLAWRCRDRPDIVIWDEELVASENWEVLRASDCYVSLHRSEGLGLNIAEAMSLGMPVIVSQFSGNMDFCTKENSLLVGGTLTRPSVAWNSPYRNAGEWFEPDLSSAAAHMQLVVRDRTATQSVEHEAMISIRNLSDPQAVSEFVRERVSIHGERQPSLVFGASADIATVKAAGSPFRRVQLPDFEAARLDPAQSILLAGRPGRFRNWLRRFMFRAAQSNLWYQRRLVEQQSEYLANHIQAQLGAALEQMGIATTVWVAEGKPTVIPSNEESVGARHLDEGEAV